MWPPFRLGMKASSQDKAIVDLKRVLGRGSSPRLRVSVRTN